MLKIGNSFLAEIEENGIIRQRLKYLM